MNDKFTTLITEINKIEKSGNNKRSFYTDLGRVAKTHIKKGEEYEVREEKKEPVKPRYTFTPYSWMDFVNEADLQKLRRGGFVTKKMLQDRANQMGIDITPYLPQVDDLTMLLNMARERSKSKDLDSIRDVMRSIYSEEGWDPRLSLKAYEDELTKKERLAKLFNDWKANNPDAYKRFLEEGRNYEVGRNTLTTDDQKFNDALEERLGLKDARAEVNAGFNPLAMGVPNEKTYISQDHFGQTIPRTFMHFKTDENGYPIMNEDGTYEKVPRTLTAKQYTDLVRNIRNAQWKGITNYLSYASQFGKQIDDYTKDPHLVNNYNLARMMMKKPILDSAGNDLRFMTPEDFNYHYVKLGAKRLGGMHDDLNDDGPDNDDDFDWDGFFRSFNESDESEEEDRKKIDAYAGLKEVYDEENEN